MPRLANRAALLFLGVALAACGQVDPVVMSVGMVECVYQGPSSMEVGNARVTLTLHGLGRGGLSLVELADGKTHHDLSDHFETVSEVWDERPDWAESKGLLEVSDQEGVTADSRNFGMSPGAYAFVCIDYPYDGTEPTSRVAASLRVNSG